MQIDDSLLQAAQDVVHAFDFHRLCQRGIVQG